MKKIRLIATAASVFFGMSVATMASVVAIKNNESYVQVAAASGDTHVINSTTSGVTGTWFSSKSLNNSAALGSLEYTPSYAFSSLSLNTRTNKSTSKVSVSVTVDGNAWGETIDLEPSKTLDTVFASTAPLSGKIVITFINNSGSGSGKGSLWVNSFTLTEAEAGPSKTLETISVAAAPTTTVYTEGENFDPTGLVITAKYDDQSTDTVAYAGNESKFTFSPSLTTALAATDTAVQIAYGGKTCTQAITVKTLASLAITGTPTKTAYTEGENFDPTGLVVTGTYSDGSTATLTDNVTWSEHTMTLGETSVSVTATVGSITSAAYTATGLTVEEVKTITHTMSQADLGGVALKAGTNTVASATFDKGDGSTAPAWNSAGEIRVYAKGYFTVKASNAYLLTSVKVTFVTNANKNGVSPTAKYYAGASDAAKSYTTACASDTVYTFEEGVEEFAIYAEGSAGNLGIKAVEIGFAANDVQDPVTSVTVGGDLVKKTQYVGQPFDTTGLDFTANCESGKTFAVLESEISWDAMTAGASTVTGSYSEDNIPVTYTGDIEVKASANIEERVFINKLTSDATSSANNPGSDTDYVLGTIALTDCSSIYNSPNGIKVASNSNKGSMNIASTSGKVIKTVTVLAYSGDGKDDLHEMTIGNVTKTIAATEYAEYTFDVYAANSATAKLECAAHNKMWIHSITLELTDSHDTVVTNFVNNYMHPEVATTTSGSGACVSEGWYEAAKEAFNALTAEQKSLFMTDAKFADMFARLQAWAIANGETLSSAGVFSANSFWNNSDHSSLAVVSATAALGLVGAAAMFIARKKKHQ